MGKLVDSAIAERTHRLLTPQAAVLLIAAGIGWVVVIDWSYLGWPMAGDMGLELPVFLVVWTVMMAAMMLPSVVPLASTFSRSSSERRAQRLTFFTAGYLVVWACAGVLAFALGALVAGRAEVDPSIGTAAASCAYVACGLYQLSPIKNRLLGRCRSRLPLRLEDSSDDGSLGNLQIGAQQGAYCLGSSWSLMIVLMALGTMNLAPMLATSTIVVTEKLWSSGENFARLVGIASLVLAVATIAIPDLVPGFSPPM